METTTPTPDFLVFGQPTAPAALREFRAGPLRVCFDPANASLRRIHLGGVEVLRGIYGAVRDEHWGTVPWEISDLRIEDGEDRFLIRFESRHRAGRIDFCWRGRIQGGADGAVSFDFDGEARSTFLRNRIGFCVLHPMQCAGAPCRVHSQDGRVMLTAFPGVIAREQPVAGFGRLTGMAHEVSAGVWAELRFTGEEFEMEDQRNWIDASFKTFCTSLRHPIPVEVVSGQRVRQGVALALVGTAGAPLTVPADPGTTVTRPVAGSERVVEAAVDWHAEPGRFPELGLSAGPLARPLHDSELERLAGLPVNHLRVEVHLANPAWRAAMETPVRTANALGLPLELVIELPRDGSPGGLPALRGELTRLRADVSRVLALQAGFATTPPAVLGAVQHAFADTGALIGVGTDGDLFSLNQQPPPELGDFIAWSMTPQGHLTDHRSIAETPEAAAQQAASVRAYYPGLPQVVGPITLKPRRPAGASQGGGLPPTVDPRQASLFGAAWTLGMLAALAYEKVDSVTFFELVGWRGVMEAEEGGPLPDLFPSVPGGAFPLWHLLVSLSGFRDLVPVQTCSPRRLGALAARGRRGERRLWAGNLSEHATTLRLPEGCEAECVRVLDSSSALSAMREPRAFWRGRPGRPARDVLLGPYALAWIDFEPVSVALSQAR